MLRGYTARLGKREKLCTRLCSASQLQRTTQFTNTRLIQSIAFRSSTQCAISPFMSSHVGRSSSFHPLQHLARRSFSLPEHEVIGLPALSPSVEESKIVSWKKKEGDLCEADEPIASVQTDKAELDWTLTDDVYLAKILLAEGETVKCGTPACIFVENQADVAAFKNYSASSASATPATPAAPAAAASTPTPAAAAPTAKSNSNYPEHKVEGLPALSPTAVDGAIVEWLVSEGDRVEEGTGIAEIQTDKSVVTWTSTDDAYLAKRLVPADADSKLAVGTPLAVFVDEQSDVAAFKDFVAVAGSSGSAPGENSATPASEAPASSAPAAAEAPKSQSSAPSSSSGRVAASPYAKKLAQEMGIDMSRVGTASGNRGRIVAADVLKAATQASQEAAKPAKAAAAAPARVLSGERTFTDEPVSAMREIIGKRLSESMLTSPHFYVTMECAMDSLMRMRAELNCDVDKADAISVNDFIIKAVGAALRDCPECNVAWIAKDGAKPLMRRYDYVDVSVAVATPTGLITPIIKDVDRKTIKEVSTEMKDLARRAKDNRLLPEEFQGGTFTISNMGMFGVSNFTAIINPPQACILAVGGAKKKLVPDESSAKGFRTATTMEVTLSSDHRSVDGALAAMWINAFQKYIERPAKLML